jgi:signal transduction histidine kinase
MEIENMRNEIARDLHDDMGSTLSSIHIISQLALKESQAEPSTKYFQRISENSAKMMESMSDMVWSINPDNDSLQKMLTKMKEFSAEILEPKNMGYQFQGEETLNGAVLDLASRKNVFLIFKESINNTAKYSEGSFVNIHFSQIANDLLLTISDNGKGFDHTKVHNGNGLKNMKARAQEINAQLNLESKLGQGTILKLKLALT